MVWEDVTIEIDKYGHVLQECAIAYGRRVTGGELSEQTSLKATYTENRFVHLDESNEVWLLGVPVESKNSELTTLSLPQGQEYFDFETIFKILQDLDQTNPNLLAWEQHFYWDGALSSVLPLGEVSPQHLRARSKVAVVADEQIRAVFSGVDGLDGYLRDKGKYEFDSGYWWNPGLTQSYLGSDRFYLPATTTDPFGNETQVEYDSYHLLVTKVTDAIGNETTVEAMDYQTLQPQKIKDINDNTSEVRFDALGMVVLTSHYGTENGQEVGFAPLSDRPLPAFEMKEAIANPQTYLQGAASYFHYDLFAWKNDGIPVHAVNLVAENYPIDTRVQTHISYSDGFGREVQTKMRVEAGTAFSVNPNGTVGEKEESDPRWLSSGGTVYNNKGNPVQKYEPYYIDTYEYVDNPTLNKFGVSSVLYYDPLQRVIRVNTPKGFFTKVEFTPWEEKHYDEDDTVIDSRYYKENIHQLPPSSGEYQALVEAAKFYDTPEIKILDNLGRTVQEVQLLEDKTQLVTHYELDIVGNQLSSADPRLAEQGIKNFETIYNLTQTALKTVSADGGTHWALHNIFNKIVYVKYTLNFEVTTEYDALHRPTEVRVKGGDDVSHLLDNVVERMVYGEDESITNPKDYNLRGQVYQHYDSAGLVQVQGNSINGQPLVSQRQLRQGYQEEANWSDAAQEALQKATVYRTSTSYDALGRVIAETDVDENIHRPTYHLSGGLAQLEVTHGGETEPTTYVSSIDYNPKGQRTRIVYGNGVATDYKYEATTFRLTRILTKRAKKTLQDLNYTYDPVGNITQIADNAWKTVFNNNQKVDPVSKYTYDALYRLLEATGREHPALSEPQERYGDIPSEQLPNLNDGQAVENYTRRYTYDPGGNLYCIQHQGKTSRTRNLTVSEDSNRAVDRELLNGENYIDRFFDANGNQIKMQGIPQVRWNYRDNIASVTIIEREDSNNDGEYYVYDSGGSRVRKVTERYNGSLTHIEEAIYLGGVEIRLSRQGETVTEERHCLRVMDDTTCIAVRNKWTEGEPPEGVSNPQVRYQLDNHLGSATMELDAAGQLISYEEYFPYGGTAFVAGRSLAEVKLKQYRYSGKERDGATGLYYYGARYYAPWLGRWLSCDPAGTLDGLNLYGFVRGNPVTFTDPAGEVRKKLRLSGAQKRKKQRASQNEPEKNEPEKNERARWHEEMQRTFDELNKELDEIEPRVKRVVQERVVQEIEEYKRLNKRLDEAQSLRWSLENEKRLLKEQDSVLFAEVVEEQGRAFVEEQARAFVEETKNFNEWRARNREGIPTRLEKEEVAEPQGARGGVNPQGGQQQERWTVETHEDVENHFQEAELQVRTRWNEFKQTLERGDFSQSRGSIKGLGHHYWVNSTHENTVFYQIKKTQRTVEVHSVGRHYNNTKYKIFAGKQRNYKQM